MNAHPWSGKPLSAADKRLVARLAVALTEYYGAELSQKHFRQVTRLLMHGEAPMRDCITSVDIESMVV